MNNGPILVVDDDPMILSVVSEILQLEGYSVETAADGAEALDSVERLHPSLVLLDMRMPGMDGWGFADRLRKRGVRVPIVVMTAAQNAKRWAEEIHAEGYVAKPFELMDLLNAVENLRKAA